MFSKIRIKDEEAFFEKGDTLDKEQELSQVLDSNCELFKELQSAVPDEENAVFHFIETQSKNSKRNIRKMVILFNSGEFGFDMKKLQNDPKFVVESGIGFQLKEILDISFEKVNNVLLDLLLKYGPSDFSALTQATLTHCPKGSIFSRFQAISFLLKSEKQHKFS